MRRFPRSATTLFFDPEAEPVAEVADGERIVVETADSLCGLAKARLAGAGPGDGHLRQPQALRGAGIVHDGPHGGGHGRPPGWSIPDRSVRD